MLATNMKNGKDRKFPNGLITTTGKQGLLTRFVRFMTTRSVCLTFILTLCFLSLIATSSQFSYNSNSVKVVEISGSNLREESIKLHARRVKAVRLRVEDVSPQELAATKQQAELESKELQRGNSLLGNVDRGVGNNTAKHSPMNPAFKTVFKDTAKKEVKTHRINLNDLNEKLRIANARRKPISLNQKGSDQDYNLTDGNDLVANHRTRMDPKRKLLLSNISKYLAKTTNSTYVRNYYNSHVTLLPEQTKGVIIVTNYRSGSTFLGELFNQHPDAFYTFEPLFPFAEGCANQVSFKAKLLNRLLKCDFPNEIDVYSQIDKPLKKTHVDIECLTNNFCFRKHTKELCEKSLCPLWKYKNCRKCGPVHLPRAMNTCRAKQISVTKVIRLCDIMDLKSVLTNPDLDVKIVHLIRDPRGIQSSRLKIHSNWSISSNADATCKRLLNNGQRGLANTTDTKWLRGRYLRIRYEDLSLYPKVEAERIYKFAGLDFLPALKRWIDKSTHGGKSKDPYSTTRNSAAAMQAWRSHLNFKQVTSIQRVCSDMMDLFGYKALKSEKDLKNFDIDLMR